jgi:hypothetical protein
MKALTLTQPWATFMVRRAPGAIVPPKAIETRNWSTSYRGRLYIHAAKGFPREAVELCFREPYASTLRSLGITKPGDLVRGAIIGAVDVQNVEEITPDYVDVIAARYRDDALAVLDAELGNYSLEDGRRFAWWCGAAHEFATPFPCRGALGLWNVTSDDLVARIQSIDAGDVVTPAGAL